MRVDVGGCRPGARSGSLERLSRRLSLGLLQGALILLTGIVGSGIGVASSWQHVVFRESDRVIHNPHMGWVYIDNAVPGHVDAGRSVPLVRDRTVWGEVDNVAVLSAWGLIEREPGVYDWSLVDQAVDYWSRQGKTIHFRLSTDPMVIAQIGVNHGPPDWLYEMGLPYMVREEVGVDIRFPDYTHPLYFPHLERFVNAFAERYKDHPAVELVDLRGYGTWGEWHSGHDTPSLSARRDVLRRIVQIWSDAFGDTMLALSNSYEWRTEIAPYGISINQMPKPTYEEYVRASLFDEAYNLPNVSLRRDGVAGYVFDEYDGRLIHDFFRSTRRPVTAEIAGGFVRFHNWQLPGYTPRRAIDEALGFHPNYIMMMGWDLVGYDVSKDVNADSALYFYNRESAGLMQYALRHMGYRLVPVSVKFPRFLSPGAAFELFHTWENRGQGRLYRPYRLGIFLLAADEVVWSAVDESVSFTDLVVGKTAPMRSRFTLPQEIPAGEYTLALAVVDREGVPAIRLAVAGHEDDELLELGRVTVRTDAGEKVAVGQAAEGPIGMEALPRVVRPGEPFTLDGEAAGIQGTGVYRIVFQYKASSPPYEHVGAEGAFRFAVRSVAGGKIAAELAWRDEAGSEWGTNSLYVAIDDEEGYRLEWTVAGGPGGPASRAAGEVEIAGIVVERVPAQDVWRADLTTLGGLDVRSQVTSQSLVLERAFDPMRYRDEDFVWMATVPQEVPLEPGAAYTVQFRVRQLSGKGYGSYFFARAASDSVKGEEAPSGEIRWLYDKESPSTLLSFTVHTGAAPDARIEWGVHNGGALAVEEIIIVRA